MGCLTVLQCIFKEFSKHMCSIRCINMWSLIGICSKYNALQFFLWRCDPMRAMASSFLRLLDHAQRRTTVGRTPLEE